MAFPAKFPSLNAMEMTDEARRTLVRVLRVAFPHENFPDGPYERTADKILVEADAETWFRVALIQGLQSLDQLSDKSFCSLNDDEALRVLRRVEGTEFFGFVRRTAALGLYDDEEVWEILGYQGPSFDLRRLCQSRIQRSGLAARTAHPLSGGRGPAGTRPRCAPGTADGQRGRRIDESAER